MRDCYNYSVDSLLCVPGVWVSPSTMEKILWSITICPVLTVCPGCPQLVLSEKRCCTGWIWQQLLSGFLCFSDILIDHNYFTLPQSPLNCTFGWFQQKGQSLIPPHHKQCNWFCCLQWKLLYVFTQKTVECRTWSVFSFSSVIFCIRLSLYRAQQSPVLNCPRGTLVLSCMSNDSSWATISLLKEISM